MAKKGYLFYFGEISIRALIECNNAESLIANEKRLCALDESRSRPEDIGIKNYFGKDISNFEAGIFFFRAL